LPPKRITYANVCSASPVLTYVSHSDIFVGEMNRYTQTRGAELMQGNARTTATTRRTASAGSTAEAAYAAAKRLFNRSDYEGCVNIAQAALERFGDDPAAAKLLLALAMGLYYLGRMNELVDVLQRMAGMDLPEEIRCRYLVLCGRKLLYERDPGAVPLLEDAAAACHAAGALQDEAWAQLSAARSCLVSEQFAEAIQWTEQVSYAPYQAKALLLRGEAELGRGNVDIARDLLSQARWLQLDDVDAPRADYLEAYCRYRSGDLIGAQLALGRAWYGANAAKQFDYELINAIQALRMSLFPGKEVTA